MAKRVAKKKVKSKQSVEEQDNSIVPTTPELNEPSIADKQYIFENYGKMTTEQLANATKLTPEQVDRLITSSETDAPQGQKPPGLRRFGKVPGGGAIMTEAQSALDDKMLREQQSKPADLKKQFGDGFEFIKVKKDL